MTEDSKKWIDETRRVLNEEADAVRSVSENLDENAIKQIVPMLLNCSGKVVVTGIGKSGAIGRKFAATLASTGTPSFYLHPAEALHGDLGMISGGDVVVAFSYSGETDEILAILPSIMRFQAPIIAITGKANSTLGQAAKVVMNVSVEKEACIFNLAPTTSTTVMLAISDAIAIAVMGARNFTSDNFALRHPAGALGRRLLLRVSDVMRTGESVAIVDESALLRDTLFAITKAHAGAAVVVDKNGKLSGIVTDGDVRRKLLEGVDCLERPVFETMHKNPGAVPCDILAAKGLDLLGDFHPHPGARVGEAPVVDSNGRPVGMLMLKDLVKAGLA